MANSFAADPTLPDPLLVTTRRPIDSAAVLPIGELSNWLLAEMGAGNWWAQNWPDGLPEDLLVATDVAQVVIPLVGARHTGLTCLVDCKPNAAVDLLVGMARTPAGGGLTVIAAGSARAWFRVACEAMSGGAEDVYGLRVNGKGTIYGVSVEVAPLTSPLAAGTEDGVEPLGLVSLGNTYPLTAHAGRALVGNLTALATRPRSLMAWSAVLNTSAPAATQHPPLLLAKDVGGWSRRQPGVDATYQIRVLVGGAAGRVWVGQVELAAPGGTAWLSAVASVPASAADYEHDLPPNNDALRDYLRPTVTSATANSLAALSDVSWGPSGVISDPGVEILAVCVWGV